MNKTMMNKIQQLITEQPNLHKVEMNIKCKTKDGMIYTLSSSIYEKENLNTEHFSQLVYESSFDDLLHITEGIERGGFWICHEEMVSIEAREIVRVWSEIGDLYYDGYPLAQ